MSVTKSSAREYRQDRIRKKIRGTSERPRLSVFRSLRHFYAQIVDDLAGKTLLGVSTRSKEWDAKGAGNVEGAKAFGQVVAKKALEKKITQVVFDRSGYIYHGRVKAFADGAREGGLKF